MNDAVQENVGGVSPKQVLPIRTSRIREVFQYLRPAILTEEEVQQFLACFVDDDIRLAMRRLLIGGGNEPLCEESFDFVDKNRTPISLYKKQIDQIIETIHIGEKMFRLALYRHQPGGSKQTRNYQLWEIKK